MKQIAIATVGVDAKDLTVLKSVLNLVAGSVGMAWQPVEQPGEAQLAFIGPAGRDRLVDLAKALGDRVLLVYCCQRDEAPPAGVAVTHCPPRANELAKLFSDAAARPAAQRGPAAAAPPPARTAVAAAEASPLHAPLFDGELCLAGAIHATLPRLLIDQPLLALLPELPPLLVDVHAGLRTVHSDPLWFKRQEPWRAARGSWLLSSDIDGGRLAECRRFPPRPYAALRFWGTVGASMGRPCRELARAESVSLKKMPDFRTLPHADWHTILAKAMVEDKATLSHWAGVAARPVAEVVDFVNGCAALGLLKT